MQRLLAYIFSGMASMVGWHLGRLVGETAGFFAAIIAAAFTLYYARRYLRSLLG